ncbi:LysR family transcriptional regulator [Chitinivorax sp. B]|uniref:LysR family transcriptional regulator n=1 Tax=Chitinivorax sp. B TaxID=2502235 RepID=UPI0010F844A0|nr:LysR family transcriptional regulator [Chitinivorax sp. B]
MISTEALHAFAVAAELGSFSACARRLGRSQSTISETISNFEIELGVTLFDRGGRRPILTEAGRQLLPYAQSMLNTQDAMRRVAGSLIAGVESRLSLVVSDTVQSGTLEQLLVAFEQQFPDLELEFLVGEAADVIEMLRVGRAHLGFAATMPSYPQDIGHSPLPECTELTLFAARHHVLAQPKRQLSMTDLQTERELRLSTYSDAPLQSQSIRCWSAPSYLLLLEMARHGFGWATLPRWLAETFGGGDLVELNVPGWPLEMSVDVLWLRGRDYGQAALWVLARLAGAVSGMTVSEISAT